MLELGLFIVLVLFVLVMTEVHERRKKRDKSGKPVDSDKPSIPTRPEGCCGTHLVCEKESLLQTNAKPEYYDDEELDSLAGIAPEQFTAEQHNAILQVFDTLQEKDVPGWCRSLQLRNIQLPADIRDEALLIVREQRNR